jgi:hypothetical protein
MERAVGVARGHWRDVKNQRLFVENLGHVLGIKTFEDWYQNPKSNST